MNFCFCQLGQCARALIRSAVELHCQCPKGLGRPEDPGRSFADAVSALAGRLVLIEDPPAGGANGFAGLPRWMSTTLGRGRLLHAAAPCCNADTFEALWFHSQLSAMRKFPVFLNGPVEKEQVAQRFVDPLVR